MPYTVKTIFYSLQGEGARSGRPAVFCRFSGCNLWNGREKDKANSSCWFCDTDFSGTDGPGGGKFLVAADLADSINSFWPKGHSRPYVIFTGGEPLLQLDDALIGCIKEYGFEIAIETNGTLEAPEGIDWITVSPKPKGELKLKSGNELKLVYPHDVTPESVASLSFDHFYLSPMNLDDPASTMEHIKMAINYCLRNPQWKLTHQMHKFWNIP